MNYFKKGRRCAVPGSGRKKDPNSKAGLLRAKQEQEQYQREVDKFNAFINASSGEFNGFEFVKVFHEHFDKKDAIFTERNSNVTTYFFAKPEEANKSVYFNKSIYIF